MKALSRSRLPSRLKKYEMMYERNRLIAEALNTPDHQQQIHRKFYRKPKNGIFLNYVWSSISMPAGSVLGQRFWTIPGQITDRPREPSWEFG